MSTQLNTLLADNWIDEVKQEVKAFLQDQTPGRVLDMGFCRMAHLHNESGDPHEHLVELQYAGGQPQIWRFPPATAQATLESSSDSEQETK